MCPTSAHSLYLSVAVSLCLCVYFHISFNLSNSRVRRVSIYSLSLCSTGGAFAAGSFCSPQPLATWLPLPLSPTLYPSAPLTGDYFDRVRLAYLWSQRSGHWKDTDAHTHTHTLTHTKGWGASDTDIDTWPRFLLQLVLCHSACLFIFA